jgi:hypothetical protein
LNQDKARINLQPQLFLRQQLKIALMSWLSKILLLNWKETACQAAQTKLTTTMTNRRGTSLNRARPKDIKVNLNTQTNQEKPRRRHWSLGIRWLRTLTKRKLKGQQEARPFATRTAVLL